MVPYPVRTETFEGPFDLLLHLILKEEVDLYEISLSTIVDSYLAELARMDDLDLEVATEFLLTAAILVELKTRRLLPQEGSGDLEDELGLWEHRDLLLAHLVECKTFKEASKILQVLLVDAARSYPRVAGPEQHFLELTPDLLEGVSADDLRAAYHRAIRPRPSPHVSLEHVTSIRVSVSEAIEEVVDELRRSPTMTFRDLTAALVERVEIVVRFLAVLELYKQGMIGLDQLESFGDITITWQGGLAGSVFDLELVDAYEG